MTSSFSGANVRAIAQAIALVCGKTAALPEHLQFLVVKHLLWAATTFDDDGADIKYFGQRYWSKAALSLVRDRIVSHSPLQLAAGLIHEHAVPRCLINDELDRMHGTNALTAEGIAGLLRFAVAVVVTREDNATLDAKFKTTMPNGFSFADSDNILARYHEVSIPVIELDTQISKMLGQGMMPDGGIDTLFSRAIPVLHACRAEGSTGNVCGA
jgi:hypothetical protein